MFSGVPYSELTVYKLSEHTVEAISRNARKIMGAVFLFAFNLTYFMSLICEILKNGKFTYLRKVQMIFVCVLYI